MLQEVKKKREKREVDIDDASFSSFIVIRLFARETYFPRSWQDFVKRDKFYIYILLQVPLVARTTDRSTIERGIHFQVLRTTNAMQVGCIVIVQSRSSNSSKVSSAWRPLDAVSAHSCIHSRHLTVPQNQIHRMTRTSSRGEGHWLGPTINQCFRIINPAPPRVACNLRQDNDF